ncbi:MAG: segregation/condensation protein A, partial [Nanoarchaeota archaeon]|nr:segregation/condensation protein A [Nanoarchaeota archaeon]
MQDQIYNLLVSEDKITWKTLIYELIKTEQLNPWDIDISLLSKRYVESIRTLKNANFFVSGKMLLASAILLKMKSNKLLTEDISRFDSQLYAGEEELLDTYEPMGIGTRFNQEIAEPRLTIRTPLPRKRKVTIQDLMDALQKALEVNQRRVIRHKERTQTNIKMPEKKTDILEVISTVYNKIKDFFITKKEKLTFTKLVQSEKREDKIYNIIPLLHLDYQQKINLKQEQHFGEIEIEILGK